MPAPRLLSLVLALSLVACSAESPSNLMAPTTTLASKGATSGSGTSGGSGGTSGGSGSTSTPHFISPDSGAPTIANPVVQFWAKKGVDTTVSMFYHAVPGRTDSTTYFSIRVRAQSLLRRPDGTPIATGDSVLITLTLTDTTNLTVDCQPSGLIFDPKHPAVIRMSYAHASHDLDGDGIVSPLDQALTAALFVWRRETPTSPWLLVPSTNTTDTDEVEASIGGFTGYALAW